VKDLTLNYRAFQIVSPATLEKKIKKVKKKSTYVIPTVFKEHISLVKKYQIVYDK
jgi:hypothetical protein